QREVLLPAGKSGSGLDRVRALAEAFLAHLERRVFPGGCFFAAVSVQLAAHPGRARERVVGVDNLWHQQFVGALREAGDQGQLPAKTDFDQTVFEIIAMLLRANYTWILTGDARALDQARTGIEHVLEGAADRPKRARASRRRT